MLERLERWGVRLFCTDDAAPSDEALPVGRHDIGKDQTQHSESNNSRQRHGFARFRRRTCVVSRLVEMVDATLALFAFYHCNGGSFTPALGGSNPLGVGLQAEAAPVPQLAHQRAADRMALGLKLVGKLAQALAGPAQRPLWIAARGRLDQSLPIAHQVGISLAGRLAAAACATEPTGCKGRRFGQVAPPAPNGAVATPVARHTAAMPPYPAALASAATRRRRPRSSKIEDSAA